MQIQFKTYFRDFKKGRHERNLLEVMVFVLYLLTSLRNIYSRAWKLAYWIEYVKMKKIFLRRLGNNKTNIRAVLKLTQTNGYNIAYRINIYLSLLTRLGQAFPINTQKIIWKDSIEKDCGVIFVSVHLPLIKVAIAKLIEDGHEINAGLSSSTERNMSFWGITNKIPIIKTGSMSLLKVKSILNKKGCVVMMADTEPLSMIYPNIFHLAAKTNARILFLLAYLNKKGVVEIILTKPPHYQITNHLQIEENITALRIARDEILIKYANQYGSILK